ncbi:MAG: DUF3343 domain-containing protein [Coriobacteriia bacterium]|nr:DUF3343 domain-containing protein [Coriobacteriia bacterium]
MGTSERSYYVLVEGTTEGMALYAALRDAGCKVRISPVPRGLQSCCGMSLLVKADDMPDVRAALELPGMPGYERIVEMENQINPNRDVYC